MKKKPILTMAERGRNHRQRRELAGYQLIHVDITPAAAAALDDLVPLYYSTKALAVSEALILLSRN